MSTYKLKRDFIAGGSNVITPGSNEPIYQLKRIFKKGEIVEGEEIGDAESAIEHSILVLTSSGTRMDGSAYNDASQFQIPFSQVTLVEKSATSNTYKVVITILILGSIFMLLKLFKVI